MKRAGALLLLLTGCQVGQSLHAPEPGWERMLEQPRADPYGENQFFADGMSMRVPPAGTVAADSPAVPTPVRTGVEDGRFVPVIPVPLDLPVLQRGKRQFEVTCSVCHGITGDGVSVVAQKMRLRPPPSLHEDRIRAFPPGQLFAEITGGYGLMPSYSEVLDVTDRWAVVAYVKALQLSRRAGVAELPPALQQEVREALP